MYLQIKGTENAHRLPIDQDAWMLFRFKNQELVRIHLEPGTAIKTQMNP